MYGEKLRSTCLWRTADLVFIQNGMLQPWLDEKGLGDNTQARVGILPSSATDYEAGNQGRGRARFLRWHAVRGICARQHCPLVSQVKVGRLIMHV